MSQEILDRKCPGCGAPVTINTNECKYCGREIEITTFNSVYSMPAPMVNRYVGYYKNELQTDPEDKGVNKAIGICLLKLSDQIIPAWGHIVCILLQKQEKR